MSLIKVNQLSTLDAAVTREVTANTGLKIPEGEALSIQGQILADGNQVGTTGQFLTSINNGENVAWASLPQNISPTSDVTFNNLLVTGNLEIQGTVDFNLSGFTTTDLVEGTRLYFTNERVDDRVAALVQAGNGISTTYDDIGNLLTISADFTEYDTDAITEGSTNLFFTDTRVHSAISVDNSANETGDAETTGYGSLSYDGAGLYTYEGPTRQDFRNSFGVSNSGGFGSLTYDSASGTTSYTGVTQTQIRQQVSVFNVSGYGSLSYSSTGTTAGQIRFTGVSDSQIRQRFSTVGGNPNNTGLNETDNAYSWGSINLDTGTGQLSYAGITTQDIRSLFAASGSLSYNALTGTFNYVASAVPSSEIYSGINTSPNFTNGDVTDSIQNLHVNNIAYQLVKIQSIAVASNVGTVTAANHEYVAGDRIKILQTGNQHLDGIYIVQTVNTGVSFTIDTLNVNNGTYNGVSLLANSLVVGSGYTNGTNVATSSVNGSGLTVNITTNSGQVTSVTINNQGDGNYEDGDVVTITQTGSNNNASFVINVADAKRQSTFTGDLVIEGSLNVNGSKIGLSDLFVGTNLIRLNSDLSDSSIPSPLGDDDAIIEVNRGSLLDTAIRWNESTGRWQFTNDGINYNNMLLPSETDFGAPEEFGASGDPSRYDVSSITSTNINGLSRVVVTVSDASKFKPNHNVKVFGLSRTADLSAKFGTVPPPQGTVASNPLPAGTRWCYVYVTALLDTETGDISGCSIPDTNQIVFNNNPGNLNEENYNTISLQRQNSRQAVLVYRFAAADPGSDLAPAINARADLLLGTNRDDFRLIAVVGAKYFSGGNIFSYQDYGSYDVTRNSLRNADGSFGSDISDPRADEIHVPHTPNYPGQHRHGYVSSDILNVNLATNQITLRGSIWSEEPLSDPDENVVTLYNNIGTEDVYLYHDDTKSLQNAINDSKTNGRDFLVIPGGTYLITQLVIPDRFTLRGLADATILHRQYWNTEKITDTDVSADGQRGNMLKSINFDGSDVETSGSVDCSLGDIVFDGSAKYQVLGPASNFDSGPETSTNDAVINAINSSFFRMTNVKIRQSAGPALVAGGSENISIDGCIFYNGADVERFATPCIVADEGDTTIVSNCVFRDFPGPLIFNSTNVLAVNGCTIRNCGSGLRIYGASKTDVLNNLILGPADEWIPVPDSYDSDFNGVNLIVEQGASDNFTPVLQYIESGSGVDLSNVNIRAQVLPVTVSGGVETVDFQNPILLNGNDVIQYQAAGIINGQLNTADITIGQVLFNITQASANRILAVNPPAPNQYNVYRAFGIRYVDIGSDTDFTIIEGAVSAGNYILDVEKILYDSVTFGSYIKLSSSHTYNPNVTAPGDLIWEVITKAVTTGPVYRITLSPRSENSSGVIGSVTGTLTSVGSNPVNGYASIRNTFTIAKGVVGISF